jgi:hypothetical protein
MRVLSTQSLPEYLPVGIQESKMSHAKMPWLGIFKPAQKNDAGFHWRVVRAAAGLILGIEGWMKCCDLRRQPKNRGRRGKPQGPQGPQGAWYLASPRVNHWTTCEGVRQNPEWKPAMIKSYPIYKMILGVGCTFDLQTVDWSRPCASTRANRIRIG